MTSSMQVPGRRLARLLRRPPGESSGGGVVRQQRGVLATIGLAIAALLLVVAVLGPVLAPQDPDRLDLLAANRGPEASHLLGTDDQGRDLLSRVLVGARTTLGPAIAVVVLSTLAATLIAIVSAWRGGWFDATVSRVIDALFAFPGLLLAILAVAVFGKGLIAPVVALAIAYVPYTARLLRAQAIRELSLPYIDALRSQGISTSAICLRHLLRALATSIAALSTVTVGYAILDLSAVSFLGLGTQPPAADWGRMVAEGQASLLAGNPQQVLVAGVAIVISVVAVNLLGEHIGDLTSRDRR